MGLAPGPPQAGPYHDPVVAVATGRAPGRPKPARTPPGGGAVCRAGGPIQARLNNPKRCASSAASAREFTLSLR